MQLFNLIWVYPKPVVEQTASVARDCRQKNKQAQCLNASSGVEAIILYPALFTPAIVAGGRNVEVLMLVKEGYSLTADDVNAQLKVAPGLDPIKPFHPDLLHPEGVLGHITVDPKSIDAEIIAGEYFRGILDKRTVEFYKGKKFKDLYLVKIDSEGIYSRDCQQKLYQEKGGEVQPREPREVKEKNQPREPQDDLFQEMLDEVTDKAYPRFSFPVADDVDLTRLNPRCPIQSYHPVFLDPRAEDFYKVFCCADTHLSARQAILARNPVRVIDWPENPEIQAISPAVGTLMNQNTQNFLRIMRLAQARDHTRPDVVVLAGDLVDLVKDVYPQPSQIERPEDVWGAVDLSKGVKVPVAKLSGKPAYRNFVNNLLLYSIVMQLYREGCPPMFGITGNHDAYQDPWGISPRVKPVGIEITKANDGIPVDHNLTFHEAILAFGPSYDFLPDAMLNNLDASKLIWHQVVFSPFSDYVQVFPRQTLVALGWGDDEDLVVGLGDSIDREQGKFGHLPRANQSISERQLKLLEDAIVAAKGGNRKVVLASHFTFVSFLEKVPSSPDTEGIGTLAPREEEVCEGPGPSCRIVKIPIYEKTVMGTFEKNRQVLFQKHLTGGKGANIQCVLTGHSHRRMVYELIDIDAKQFTAAAHEFQTENSAPLWSEPAIIVTDSAGPLPRFNRGGEFDGWGSDRPAGTLVTWNSDGNIVGIGTIASDLPAAKPRLAAALDSYDVIVKPVFEELRSEKYDILDGKQAESGEVGFTCSLVKEIANLGIEVEEIKTCYLLRNTWRSFVISRRHGAYSYSIRDSVSLDAFQDCVAGAENPTDLLLVIKHRCNNKELVSRYEVSEPWIRWSVAFMNGNRLEIRRNNGKPDFSTIISRFKVQG